jgi:hypothetical protein
VGKAILSERQRLRNVDYLSQEDLRPVVSAECGRGQTEVVFKLAGEVLGVSIAEKTGGLCHVAAVSE